MVPLLARMIAALWHPEAMLLVPALALLAYWSAGEIGLVAASIGLPLIVVLLHRMLPPLPQVAMSDRVLDHLAMAMRGGGSGRQLGCLVLQFDDPLLLCDRLGRTRQSEVLAASIARLRGALRPTDVLFPLEDGSLVVVLGPASRLDSDGMVRIAARLHLVAQQPLRVGEESVQLSCCIGLCHASQLSTDDPRALLEAAQVAVDEASRHRPGVIRAYSEELAKTRAERDQLRAEFLAAITAGQIRAYFQPQLSTDSGMLSGLEVLVRWHHPDRGLLLPGAFLPALDGTEMMNRLGETMLNQALAAVQLWDGAGLRVPSVAVNLSAQELRDPNLPETLAWVLDRHGLAPERLTIEVLESVAAGVGDEIIARNMARVSRMGCGIDMDDFGTGQASIASIRRLAARRLKIDRSFVRGIETDTSQQSLVTAILSLAERLEIDTVAEGVETPGEHAILAQLGCGHVQGYAIARPMPFEDVAPWVERYNRQLGAALKIGVRAR